jgi:hypothetical protein
MDPIKAFEKVRDIPYSIPLSYDEDDDCCSGKSAKLLGLLTAQGCKVRYRVCVFFWNTLPLPKAVSGVPHDADCTHTYLEINIEGKWRVLDATWDKDLKSTFHVNKWDGKSDTQMAVTPTKIFAPTKSLSIVKKQDRKTIEDDLSRNRDFYLAFNEWLNETRKKK